MDYLQAHDDKMLERMGLGVNSASSSNPWAGTDSHGATRSQPAITGSEVAGSQAGITGSRPGVTGSQAAAPLMKLKCGASAAVTMATASQRGGAGQILIYLLRLRQCCSHLSILRDVSDFILSQY